MTERRELFITPVFRGSRFDADSFPVELLPDLAAYRDLVIEVARALFIRNNPGRERVRKGFIAEFNLRLSRFEPGNSVAAVLERVHRYPGELFPPPVVADEDEFDQARDLIDDLISDGTSPTFPRELLPMFDRFGRGLHENEAIELRSPKRGASPVRYDQSVRQNLLLQSQGSYQLETETTGVLVGLTKAPAEPVITLKLPDGRFIESPYPTLMTPQLADAMHPTVEATVYVSGLGKFDKRRQLTEFSKVFEFEVQEIRSRTARTTTVARIAEMHKIEDGWLDGTGKRPTDAALALAENAMQRLSSTPQLEDAYLYPTPDGGIQVEWTINGVEITVNFLPEGNRVEASSAGERGEREISLRADGSFLDELAQFLLPSKAPPRES